MVTKANLLLAHFRLLRFRAELQAAQWLMKSSCTYFQYVALLVPRRAFVLRDTDPKAHVDPYELAESDDEDSSLRQAFEMAARQAGQVFS